METWISLSVHSCGLVLLLALLEESLRPTVCVFQGPGCVCVLEGAVKSIIRVLGSDSQME